MHAVHCSVAQCSRLIPLSVSPNSDKSGKQSLYPDGDRDRHQNLIVCSFAQCHFFLKIHANPFGSFCAKLLTDKQTDRQTDKQRREHNLGGANNYPQKTRATSELSKYCSKQYLFIEAVRTNPQNSFEGGSLQCVYLQHHHNTTSHQPH